MPRLRANACAAAGSIWLWHELHPPFATNVGLVFSSRSRALWAAALKADWDSSSLATANEEAHNNDASTKDSSRMVKLLRLLLRTGCARGQRFAQKTCQLRLAPPGGDAERRLSFAFHVDVGAARQQQSYELG